MSYEERQAEWVKNAGIEIGDSEIEPEFIQQPVFVDDIRHNFITIADRERKLHPTTRYGRLVPFYLLIKINE